MCVSDQTWFVSALTACAETLTTATAGSNKGGGGGGTKQGGGGGPEDQSGPTHDPTHLLSTLQMTDLAGTVSMLYGILLHQGMPSR